MSPSLNILLAGFVFAASASNLNAQEVRIPVAGLTLHQARAAILRAADEVCNDAALTAPGPYSTQTCVADAVAKAYDQLKEIRSMRAVQMVKSPVR